MEVGGNDSAHAYHHLPPSITPTGPALTNEDVIRNRNEGVGIMSCNGQALSKEDDRGNSEFASCVKKILKHVLSKSSKSTTDYSAISTPSSTMTTIPPSSPVARKRTSRKSCSPPGPACSKPKPSTGFSPEPEPIAGPSTNLFPLKRSAPASLAAAAVAEQVNDYSLIPPATPASPVRLIDSKNVNVMVIKELDLPPTPGVPEPEIADLAAPHLPQDLHEEEDVEYLRRERTDAQQPSSSKAGLAGEPVVQQDVFAFSSSNNFCSSPPPKKKTKSSASSFTPPTSMPPPPSPSSQIRRTVAFPTASLKCFLFQWGKQFSMVSPPRMMSILIACAEFHI